MEARVIRQTAIHTYWMAFFEIKEEITSYFFSGNMFAVVAEFVEAAEFAEAGSGSRDSAFTLSESESESESVGSDSGLAEARGLKNSQTSWSRLSATTMAFRSEIVGVVLFLIDGFWPSFS